mmetsp:Transcript_18243/g.32943  ORF Transcript_18243/g.32943 Transcript_18243/m.32943 type:complete len:758 (-) Transcript_18243:365-2638(-)
MVSPIVVSTAVERKLGLSKATIDSSSAHHLLSNITMGTKLAIYWPEDDAYYSGIVTTRHQKHCMCTVCYDDGDMETINLAEEQFRIVCGGGGNDGNGNNTLSNTVTAAVCDVKATMEELGEQQKNDDDFDSRKKMLDDDAEDEPRVTQNQRRILVSAGNDDPPIPKVVPPPIITSSIGRIPVSGPHTAFLVSDDDHEIHWPKVGNMVEEQYGWRLFRPDQEKVRFYSCSFSTKRCEIEWNNNGVVYDTCFRVATGGRERRKRKKKKDGDGNAAVRIRNMSMKKLKRKKEEKRAAIDNITVSKPNKPARDKSKPKKSHRQAKTVLANVATVSSNTNIDASLGLGMHPNESHYITNELCITRKELISTLPEEMRRMFNCCCWVIWKGMYRPALSLSPFEVTGNRGIVEEWTSTYVANQSFLSQLPYLVYWYEEGWSNSKDFKAFSLVRKEKLFSYDKGVAQGWDEPSFCNKVDDPFRYGMLTEEEDDILRGIKQMKQDQGLETNERGGPMFFPHLRDEEKRASDQRLEGLRKTYGSWASSSGYETCLRRGNTALGDSNAQPRSSLELCAGEEGMSQALAAAGFETTTLDNDLKRSATSQLSLEELERRIIDGTIRHHPHLDKSFSVMWNAPECRTWSRAQNGRYRNKDFVDGFRNRALDAHAQQARRDVESLVNILSYYRGRNPNLIMVIENPVGYLQHHPLSRLFEKVLGLTRLKISYCQFSRENDIYPQKDTHLWTNSSILIHQFGGREFECHKGKA